MQLELFPRTIPKRKLPTNLTTGHHPIHRWFNFTAGFSPEFVKSCIHEAGLEETDVLIDPFAGLSTALVQANFEGIHSVGFEPHPFFFGNAAKVTQAAYLTADATTVPANPAIAFEIV